MPRLPRYILLYKFLQKKSISGTCFCAGKGEGFQKQKVLYCFGEVSNKKINSKIYISEISESFQLSIKFKSDF